MIAVDEINININSHQEKVPILNNWRSRSKKSGYVYIISDGYAVKIGKTQHLKERISSIQNCNPRPITLLQVIETDDMDAYEHSLHSFFKERKMHGEWFDLLPVFGIKSIVDGSLVETNRTIADLKKKLHIARSENARWRRAKYEKGDNYCSQCGHALNEWFKREDVITWP